MKTRWTLLAVVFTFGCASAPNAVGTALMTTAVAAASSAASRAGGGCYASCPVGTYCQQSSGLCEELPCRGRCVGNEFCEIQPGGEGACVHARAIPLKIEQPAPARITPN